MSAVASGEVEILMQAYFGTFHSSAGESAQCIHDYWRNGPDNRYNLAAREGLDLTDAL